ncbi:hypothetical protein [Nocardioides sp. CF8]|uniref:hypothetical protein n=1 Tax=Nocardioides sp. CF8 TaxID=110319 RepID=UPI0012EC2EA8|nr:hypothetical protein [Nocardioides sp. CF8]
MTFLILAACPPAFAGNIAQCQDGTPVEVETSAGGSFAAAVAVACKGHDGDEELEDEDGSSVDPVSTETQGHWQWAGYVCDNGGICNSRLLCPDGSPKMKFVYVYADGSLGDTRQACPGDADIPTVPEVTPPSPGQIFKAFKSVVPPSAELSVQPPGGQTLVNFDTIFSTKADPFTTGEIALVPGFKVVFEVFPTAFTWKFGDGQELKTDWAGKPWTEGVDVSTLITHAYTSKKDVKASVSITWGAKASLNGGEPVPVDGTVSVASAMVPLEVLEAVPQLVE